MHTFIFFFMDGTNFDRVARKSKINGTIGSKMAASFCQDDTHCACCFHITDSFGKNVPYLKEH
ncbi:hypothetical protein SCTVLC_2023 [Serratia symbiotica SCt-VLC]|uniref:Uncharacterized protein n=1 Tax=Serratia symbiotica SCt-VLC TaxID=1347341 RepID=A0A068RD76_9GAMM|nr:hypothetical protein SCTVLC_2023 [Serratia symbiotica SCt-VLC]